MKKLYGSSNAVNFYLHHYLNSQSGGHLPYFEGLIHQQVGSGIWGNIFKTALPVLKKGVQAILPHAVDLGKNLINDVIVEKRNLRKSLRKRGLNALKDSGSTLPKRAKQDIFN